MIRQLAALLVLATAVCAYPYGYPYYGGYAAYHAPVAPVAYHAPVYHAPVATSYHNTYRYPAYRAAYAAPYYAGYHAPIAAYHAPVYHAPVVPAYARYYRSAEGQKAEAEQPAEKSE